MNRDLYNSLLPHEKEEAKEILRELEWRKCKRNPYYFLSRYVYTQDEHDKKNPFKKFPVEDLPYIKACLAVYLNQPLACFVKSRQIMLSWLFCALDLWDAMFNPGRLIFITNKREDDSAKMVYADKTGRIFVIFDRLPPWMKARVGAQWTHVTATFRNGSKIWGLPDGSEQLRSHTASRARIEEARSHLRLEETLQAARPTATGGGQIILVSSAGAGYFRDVVHDSMDREAKPPPPRRYRSPMPGVEIWKNLKNGYYCVQVHYTADPKKRDSAWIAMAKKGLADYQWDEEYEISWDSRAGRPAIGCFRDRKEKIVIQKPFKIPDTWPRFAAADYGTTNPYCWLLFAIGPDSELYVYAEYYSPGPLGQHLAELKAHPDFPKIQIYILDRSCWAETQQVSHKSVGGMTLHSLRSIADLHEADGVIASPADRVRDEVKVEACYREWGDEGTAPRTVIFASCTNLIREMALQKWDPKKPQALVDKDNHAFDAFCYGILYHRDAPMMPAPVKEIPPQHVLEEIWHREMAIADEARAIAEAQEAQQGIEDVDDDYYSGVLR